MSDYKGKIRAGTVGAKKVYAHEMVELVLEDGRLRVPHPRTEDGEANPLDAGLERVFIEARQPTVAQRAQIVIASGQAAQPDPNKPPPQIDVGKMHTAAILACAYVPLVGEDGTPRSGGNERAFEEADRASLLEGPCGGWFERLGSAIVGLMNGRAAIVGKA